MTVANNHIELSIAATTKLLTTLLDLKEQSENDNNFPQEIQTLVTGVVQPQKNLVQGITKYLLRWKPDCDVEVDIVKTIMQSFPEFTNSKDEYDRTPLHEVAHTNNLQVAEFLIDSDPSRLFKRDAYGCVPLHYAASPNNILKKTNCIEMVELLLRKAVEYYPKHESIGGLLIVPMGSMALSLMTDRYGEDETWDCIERTFTPFINSIPILHVFIQHGHDAKYYSKVIERFPDSIFNRDEQHRLPLHIALDQGMAWSSQLISMIHASKDHLNGVDPVTKLPLFVLAAKGNSCCLRTINYLLLKHPEQVEFTISMEEDEDKRPMKKPRGLYNVHE